MTSRTIPSHKSFFVINSKSNCVSLVLRDELIKEAVKKDGNPLNGGDKNLLFPPRIIRKVLSEDKVKDVLKCPCHICRAVKGRDPLTDDKLKDAVTKHDEQRRLFAVLVFMGAGFAARHLCSFHTSGWDSNTRKDSIQSHLFKPLSSSIGIAERFSKPKEVTETFLHTLETFWRLFASPTMTLKSHETNLSGENLPFIEEEELNSDNPQNSKLFTFKIDEEFKDTNIPVGTSPVFLFHMIPNRPLGNAGSEASRL
jgi:hypothetical protein